MRSMIDVKPDLTSVQDGLWPQTTWRAFGSRRQIRDCSGVAGNPVSSPMYKNPSGPTAAVVGTGSASILAGKPQTSGGPEGHPCARLSHSVETLCCGMY